MLQQTNSNNLTRLSLLRHPRKSPSGKRVCNSSRTAWKAAGASRLPVEKPSRCRPDRIEKPCRVFPTDLPSLRFSHTFGTIPPSLCRCVLFGNRLENDLRFKAQGRCMS